MSYQALADAQLTTENAPQQLQSSDGHLTGLCEHCIKIMDFLKHYLDAGAFGTVDSFDPVLSLPLQRSYECSVCSVILGDVPFEDFSAEHTADTPIVELEPIDAGKLGVGVYVSSLRQNVIDPTIPKKRGMYTSRALLRHSQKRRRYKMEASTNSLSTWKLAQSWLADCSDTHTCMSKIQKKLPTRLAHVGEENSQPRLVELNRDCAYEYCTLSHCWGKTEMLVLKRSNYIDFLKHIPVELLTQTFQDAFFTAKKLDFRYIWIDSLCIIQDDPEDWAKEAGTMSDVYSNTSLNIAATSGTDGSAGLFHDRKLHLVRFPEVVPSSENQTTSKSQQGNLSDDTQPSRYLLVNEALWNEEITASCLASRGWVVQELYLAPGLYILDETRFSGNVEAADKQSRFLTLDWTCPKVHTLKINSGLSTPLCLAMKTKICEVSPWTSGAQWWNVTLRQTLQKKKISS
ncbi:heterokaryon incompatibility protein-domain-containing protein [Halenospora varia]|nr:heterokaryon incompatibility protein-domain-containing protein [Halenospora varia]